MSRSGQVWALHMGWVEVEGGRAVDALGRSLLSVRTAIAIAHTAGTAKAKKTKPSVVQI